MADIQAPEPGLDKTRQIKYWSRCLKSLLPHHYTGNESNRMYLAFFIISALDLLDAWLTITSETERDEYANWIYHCQHPQGGFRMWPGTDFGDRASTANAKWDPANLPATYFALSALLIMGDDLKRVNRPGTLQWLRRMQREDGSFGETFVDGQIEGGSDPRFGYCAAGVRYILRGGEALGEHIPLFEGDKDVDIDLFVEYIRRAESHDGGIADEAFHEPHAGYTYCALGALKLFNRLSHTKITNSDLSTAPEEPWLTVQWLLSRQTDLDDPDAEVDFSDSGSEPETTLSITTSNTPALHQSAASTVLPNLSFPLPTQGIFSHPSLSTTDAGMCGRPNKVSDTCYGFWTSASLHLLDASHLYSAPLLRRYLLGRTQHVAVGGFGKFPGDPPDLYHSYMALAALGLKGMMGDESVERVKEVDAVLCFSVEARERIAGLWRVGGE